MKEITVHLDIRKAITMMGGVELLIRILSVPNQKLQLLASESIANLAKFKRGRANVRKHQGIPKLVDLLDVDTSKVSNLLLNHYKIQFALTLSQVFLETERSIHSNK